MRTCHSMWLNSWVPQAKKIKTTSVQWNSRTGRSHTLIRRIRLHPYSALHHLNEQTRCVPPPDTLLSALDNRRLSASITGGSPPRQPEANDAHQRDADEPRREQVRK